MTKVLIVEDEPLAAIQLAGLLAQVLPAAQIVGVCDTIESTVKWLETNPFPDLAFFDIHLGDGLSFEIFKKVKVEIPIIFTTAYDHYAIQAFKVNSIDYLLKPLNIEDLKVAILKFEKTNQGANLNYTPEIIHSLLQSITSKEYKKRFLIKVGTKLKAVNADEILYFYSFEKGTYVKTTEGKNFLMDQILEQIEQAIDPSEFFRINRKYLVNLKAIIDVSVYSNSRLKIKVPHPEDDDFLVAREKVKQFKSWFEGES